MHPTAPKTSCVFKPVVLLYPHLSAAMILLHPVLPPSYVMRRYSLPVSMHVARGFLHIYGMRLQRLGVGI